MRREAAHSASSAMAASAVSCSTSANVEHVERRAFKFLSASFGDMPQHQQQLRDWIHRYTLHLGCPLHIAGGVVAGYEPHVLHLQQDVLANVHARMAVLPLLDANPNVGIFQASANLNHRKTSPG